MLIELLRPCGAELARRWVAALLLVPVEEREAVVHSIEARIAALYTDPADDEQAGVVPRAASSNTPSSDPPLLHVAGDPVQRDGYTEQEIRTYAAPTPEQADESSASHTGDADDDRDAASRTAAG